MDTKIETNKKVNEKVDEKDEFMDSDIDDDVEISGDEELDEELDEEEDDEEENDEEDDEDMEDKDTIEGKKESNSSEITIIKQRHEIIDTANRLTIFEATRIISERALHLDNGAIPYVDITDMTSAIEIAYNEYINKKIPFIIHRKIGETLIESIPIHELELCVDFNMSDIIPNH